MDKKIYSEKQIVTGVLLGGPLAGGYFLWCDFKALGKDTHATVVAIAAMIVTLVSFGLLFAIPELQRLPTFLIPAVHIGLTYGIIRGYLADALDSHVQDGVIRYGWGNTVLIAIGFLALTLTPIFAIAYSQPSLLDSTTTRNYGRLKHEIQFSVANISEVEVDQIANALSSAGFFDDELMKSVDVAKAGDRYIITVYCNDAIRTDPAALEPFIQLLKDVQKSFPSNSIAIDLVIGTADNLFKRLE